MKQNEKREENSIRDDQLMINLKFPFSLVFMKEKTEDREGWSVWF